MSGEHYRVNGIDPITAMKEGLVSKEEYVGFLKGNIIKYVVRCEYKNDVLSDLKKAMDYLETLYEFYKEESKVKIPEWYTSNMSDVMTDPDFESDDERIKRKIHNIATILDVKEKSGYYE